MTVKKILIQLVMPIIVLLFILYFFFRDITFAAIRSSFLEIPGFYLFAFIFLSLLATVLRAWKYQILLGGKIGFKDLFLITLVRNFSVDLLPGQVAGLFFYSWLSKKKGISLAEGASSFIVSMFYDTLALACMLGVMLFFLKTALNQWPVYIGMAIIFTISGVIIFLAEPIAGWILKQELPGRLSWLKHIVQEIHDYLMGHQSKGERVRVFLLSLALRVIKYGFIYILFEGVVHLGVGFRNFSLFSFGLAGTELSSLLPIQGPAGFGTWELAFTVIFQALQIPVENLKAAGFVIHITTQVWEYFLGIMALGFLFFSKTKIGSSENRENA